MKLFLALIVGLVFWPTTFVTIATAQVRQPAHQLNLLVLYDYELMNGKAENQMKEEIHELGSKADDFYMIPEPGLRINVVDIYSYVYNASEALDEVRFELFVESGTHYCRLDPYHATIRLSSNVDYTNYQRVCGEPNGRRPVKSFSISATNDAFNVGPMIRSIGDMLGLAEDGSKNGSSCISFWNDPLREMGFERSPYWNNCSIQRLEAIIAAGGFSCMDLIH